jgi:hypothetical protein
MNENTEKTDKVERAPEKPRNAHTPGPWWIENYFARPKHCDPYFQVVADKSGIASVYENEANARLIAAAPELLAACKLVTDYEAIHLNGGIGYCVAIKTSALNAVCNAIAKVEGK